MPDFAVTTAFRGTDKISPVFNRMSASADKFGRHGSSSMNRVASASGKMFGMIKRFLPILSGAAILKFGKDSMEAWENQEAAVANVEAGLKSTGNRIGITSKQFQEMAAATQDIGIFGDETIMQNATSQLLTFGNIGKQVFDRTQKAALDVTAKLYGVKATGEQIRTTSIMLGKALDDPIRGMTAMRRVGVSFSDAEVDIVKNMVKQNNLMGAQKYILQSLERQYGGTNEALRKTDKGMELAARNKLGDTMEKIGKQIIPLKKTFYELALKILPKINDALPVIISLMEKLAPVVLAVAGGFLAYKGTLLAVAGIQKIMMVAGWVKYIIMMRGAIMKAITMTKAWAAVQWLLNAAMTANPIGLIIVAVAALGYAIYDLYKNWDKYVIGFKIGIQNWIIKWKALKVIVTDVMAAMGMASKKAQKKAEIELQIAVLEEKILKKKGNTVFKEGKLNLEELNQKDKTINQLLKKGVNAEKKGALQVERAKMIKKAAMQPITGTQSLSELQIAAMNRQTQREYQNRSFRAPNETDVQSRNINFNGQLNIAGAPEGSTVSSSTKGAKPINMQLVGAN